MLKIDSHQHFWDLQKFDYPWLNPGMEPLYRNFGPEDLAARLNEQGITGTVAVQATHSQPETEWLMAFSRQYSFVKGVVGWVDLTSYDLDQKLSRLNGLGCLVGIRHQVHDESDPRWLLQNKVLRGLRLVAEHNLTYDLLVRPVHLPVLPELFGEVDNLRWVVDHAAKPDIRNGQLEPWYSDLKRIAQYPNVYCKLSGLITEANQQSWQLADIRPYFERVLEIFGPHRLMFGSDWPVCLLAGSYGRVSQLMTELTSQLTPSEQAAIWGETAHEAYLLDITGEQYATSK